MLKLLLVLASASDRRAARSALAGAGPRIRLEEAERLEEATRWLEREPFDCLLVDPELPDGRASELLPRGQGAAMIVLIPAEDHQAARKALGEGFQDVLPKSELGAATLIRSIRYAIERKRAAELRLQLLHADRLAALGQLAAGVAHEINNPATFILVNDEQLAESARAMEDFVAAVARLSADEPDPARRRLWTETLAMHRPAARLEEARERIAENVEGMQRIVSIVKKLQTFARLRPASLGEVDLHEVIEAAARMLENELRHRGRLIRELAPEAPVVSGDRQELLQVVTNLMVNAMHALEGVPPQDAWLKVGTRVLGGSVRLVVEDDGCGIPPSIQPRIFEPFFTTKSQDRGTGLGLSICAEIVRKHRGRIEVQSEVGRGTRVEVLLPIEREPTGDLMLFAPSEEAPAPDLESLEADAAPLRILAIDDEALILAAYRRMLRDHEVVAVHGGREALSLLGVDLGFDGILCDLMMPDLDGQDFFERLRVLAPQLAGKVVFCTGGAFTAKMRDFLGRVETPVLEKPLSSEAMQRAVRHWRAR
jgi:signal transduction histidine kinase